VYTCLSIFNFAILKNHKSRSDKVAISEISCDGDGLKLAKEFNTMLPGQVPLVMEVGEAAEQGNNIFSQTNKHIVEAFEKIAELIISKAEVKP